MSNESEETLLGKKTILDAINLMRQEMNNKFDEMRQEMNGKFDGTRQEINEVRQEIKEVRQEIGRIEKDVEEIKNLQFSFDVQLERIESAAYKPLSIGHDLRADVKILHAEVSAWTKDVMRLEKQLT